MAVAKKIWIETESHEVFIIRVTRKSDLHGFCKECSADTELLTIDEAVASSGVRTIDLVGYVRESRVHYLETVSGHLLICARSLAQRSVDAGNGYAG